MRSDLIPFYLAGRGRGAALEQGKMCFLAHLKRLKIMYQKYLIKNNLSLREALRTMKYKRQFRKENPTYFDGDGLIIYTGPQGSGKTLSAVKYCCDLMEFYPRCKLVTNLMIKDYPIVSLEEFIRNFYGLSTSSEFYTMTLNAQKAIISDYLHLNRVFPFNNGDDLMRYNNLTEGVIFLIDEIQLYFNSLESKNINMDVMTEISQQRKQRKHIIATSQVFGRMAKPLREQFNTVVKCNNYFSLLQRNLFLRNEDVQTDEDFTNPHGAIDKVQFFFHRVEDYERYDTYYKVLKGKFISGEERNQDIYDRITIERRSGNA